MSEQIFEILEQLHTMRSTQHMLQIGVTCLKRVSVEDYWKACLNITGWEPPIKEVLAVPSLLGIVHNQIDMHRHT